MFQADIDMLRRVVETHGPLPTPIVDVGGLENPTVADYQKTIEAMQRAAEDWKEMESGGAKRRGADDPPMMTIHDAQMARITRPQRPLAFLGKYTIENPEAGGLAIEGLSEKYAGTSGREPLIGTALLLSVLEHVEKPWLAVDDLHAAIAPAGLVIASVPWAFPTHHGPKDCFRYSPDGLRALFDTHDWDVLECDWHLRIPSDAGVLELTTGRPQAVEACYLVARAR